MSIFILIIVALPLADLLWWWWADRKLRRWRGASGRPPRYARIVLAAFMLIQIIGFASILGARSIGLRTNAPPAPMAIIYLWHLLVLPITALVMLIDWIVKRATSMLRQPAFVDQAGDAGAMPQIRPSRRDVLAAAAVSLPPLAALATTGVAFSQMDSFRIRRIEIPLASLPPALDGLTIAQVSDVHVGRFTRKGSLPAIVEATNALRADLILLTGDLIDFLLADLPAGLDMVKRLDPRAGLFMVEGNHDLFESPAEFERGVANAGIPLLLNSDRTVYVRSAPVQLLGIRSGAASGGSRTSRADAHEQNMRATLPLLRTNPEAFPILLAHHPHAFDLAADAGIPLTLSGHTHGGQLMLTPSFGAGSIMYKYWSGLYRRGDSALVVSNGVGNWFPLRINAPAEIVHITLRKS